MRRTGRRKSTPETDEKRGPDADDLDTAVLDAITSTIAVSSRPAGSCWAG
jgi:hypothetical protein